MEAIIGEILGYIVIEGVKYLVEKVVDETGKAIWRALTDEDGDGVPDDYDNPFTTWDQEPEDWFPFLSGGDDEEKEETTGNVIIITPDGPIYLYSEEPGEEFTELVSQVTEQWVQDNGIMSKPFHNYTASEGFLFIIAVGTMISLMSKLFKRRKM